MFKGKGILAWLVTAGALLQSCGPVNAPLTVEERKSEMNWLITQIEANYAPLQYKQELLKFKWEDRKQEFLKRSEKEMTNDEYTLLAGDLYGLRLIRNLL